MSITAGLVKELRERTGAGMMECKKYLQETNGDLDKAIEEMRKSGAAKAAKREGKITAEGLVLAKTAADGKSAVILEVNCETDFVARGDDFQGFVNTVAETGLSGKLATQEELQAASFGTESNSIEETRKELAARIGENINIRRYQYLQTEGLLGAYLHGSRIAVLVDAEASADLCKDLAMHIAASQPLVVNQEDVSQELVDKEKEIFKAQAEQSGKPAEIIEKMIVGRMKKYLDEVSLMGQPFVKDPSQNVAALLKSANASVNSFVRFEVGEGIEKAEEDFAKEVMEQVRGS